MCIWVFGIWVLGLLWGLFFWFLFLRFCKIKFRVRWTGGMRSVLGSLCIPIWDSQKCKNQYGGKVRNDNEVKLGFFCKLCYVTCGEFIYLCSSGLQLELHLSCNTCLLGQCTFIISKNNFAYQISLQKLNF